MKNKLLKVFRDFLEKDIDINLDSLSLFLISSFYEEVLHRFLRILTKDKINTLFFSKKKLSFFYEKNILIRKEDEIFKILKDKNFFCDVVIVNFSNINSLRCFLSCFNIKSKYSSPKFILFLKSGLQSTDIFTHPLFDFSLLVFREKEVKNFKYKVLKNRIGFLWKGEVKV